MITREQKAEQISGISERFSKAKAAFLVDFKGMDVEAVTKLRKILHPLKSEMKVVRNTLALRALKEHPKSESALSDSLTGNNAIIFAYEDVSAAAKAVTEFCKDVEALVLKTGVMDGNKLDEQRIKYLSTLPSKQQLQAQFLGVLQAPMAKFVRTLSAVPSGFVRVLDAQRQKQG